MDPSTSCHSILGKYCDLVQVSKAFNLHTGLGDIVDGNSFEIGPLLYMYYICSF